MEQVVRDETGVEGVFDVEASWRPRSGEADPADMRPDIFTAFREQLGLKMEPGRRPVDVLVSDHIERPSGYCPWFIADVPGVPVVPSLER
jgi:uncharacterized protein (TIGR03435 family)